MAHEQPGNRKLWHALVDKGLTVAIASGQPFTVGRVLDSVGILGWAPFRSQVEAYATAEMDKAKGRQ
ncbi:MAG TPA: hypothetical protein VK603_17980 [Candidatus Saccharimonadales bacterium]|nr:hypothetical protein [Candidatus Saccharimonadales bacterium]